MTPAPDPAPFIFELALLGIGMCVVLAGLFAIVAREFEAAWARFLSIGFVLHAAGFVVAASFARRLEIAQPANIVVVAVAYLLLTEGIWRYAAGDAPAREARDAHYAATVALILVAILVATTGRLDRLVAMAVGSTVWCSWSLRFVRASGRQPGHHFLIDATACLLYPALTALNALGRLPPGMSRIPGLLPLAAFGFALLTTGLLRSHRVEVAARAVAETALRERIAAEAALRTLNESLEQRIEARTAVLRETIEGLETFNRSVSHDLRGPLGGIAGVAEIARARIEKGDVPGATRMVDAIAAQARTSFQAVDALLWLARSTGAPLNPERIDTTRLVHEVCDALRDEGALEGVEVSIAPLPPVDGDTALLRQLFRNLIGNAAKFTRGQPSARVEVGASIDDPTGGGPVFFVRDNGPGFGPADAERIFRPFVRAGDPTREGVGVGLSIVRRVVARHGGWIRAEGQPGVGAVFRFTLPGGHADD